MFHATNKKLPIQKLTPKTPWKNSFMADEYRLFIRRSLDPETERTLQAAIAPPGPTHLANIISIAFKSDEELVLAAALAGSLIYDFFVKSLAITDIRTEFALSLPYLKLDQYKNHIIPRVLALSCVNEEFAALWSSLYSEEWTRQAWSIEDQRLEYFAFNTLTRDYNRDFYLATSFSRRQALVELDVLVSLAAGLSLGDLTEAYKIQFSRLRQYEAETHFDRNGKYAFIPTKGFSNQGFSRQSTKSRVGWDLVKDMKSGTVPCVITDDTLPGGAVERTITYEAPFDRCDRVADYRITWEFFEKEMNGA